MEAKFRGKPVEPTKYGTGFVKGSLVTLEGVPFIVTVEVPITHRWINGIRYNIATDLIEVHPDSVGMWTGRVDKNKTEIYGGDLIKTKHGIYPVLWSDELARFYASCRMVTLAPWNWDIHEVIGNTTDDPKLIKD